MDSQPSLEIDQAALDKYLPGWREERTILKEMVTLYISDTGKRLGALRAAIAEGDAAQVRDLAHSMRSPSETFGAKKFADLCLQLEIIGKSRRLEHASHWQAQAELAFSAAAAELEQLCRK